jgi:large subunit ribosomal protein L29
MKSKEIAKLSAEESDKRLDELNKELIKVNAQRSSGTQLKNPGQLREIRKNIARILTIKNQNKK